MDWDHTNHDYAVKTALFLDFWISLACFFQQRDDYDMVTANQYLYWISKDQTISSHVWPSLQRLTPKIDVRLVNQSVAWSLEVLTNQD